jgi:hypothetical protein
VWIRRFIVKLRKVQRERVYEGESELAEVTEPTKLDGEHIYHHGTTQARSIEPGLQMTSKQPQITSIAIGKRTKTTSTSIIRQLG